MRISKIYISAFGKLKDFTLEFDKGLNVIFGENEDGKTTVMSFIRAMFYGTGKKTQALETSLRQKYTPMDGSSMGGRIYYEFSGKNYCLERIFNKSDATDKITLMNMDTGETHAETNEIGTRIFGMGAEAFIRSMFIGADNDNVFDSVGGGELNARLSSVALTGDENTSYQKIEKRITDAKENVLSKSGKAGTLAKLREEKANIDARLQKAEEDANKKLLIGEKIKEIYKNGEELSKKYKAIKRLLQKKDDIKNTEKLKEYLALKDELDKINEELKMQNGDIIDSAFVSKIKFCKAKIDPQKAVCQTLEADIERLKKADELSENVSAEDAQKKIDEIKTDLAKTETQKAEIEKEISIKAEELKKLNERVEALPETAKPFNMGLLIVGVVLLGLGVLVCFVLKNLVLGLGIGAAGVVLTVLSFVFKQSNKTEITKIKTEIAEIKEYIANKKGESALLSEKSVQKQGEMNTFVSVLNADKTVRENRLAEIAEKSETLKAETEKLSEIESEYKLLLGGTEIDDETLKNAEEKAEKQKSVKLKLSMLGKDLGNISYEIARQKLKSAEENGDFSDIDFDKAEAEFERINNQLVEYKQQITALETELKTAFKNSEQPEIVKREADEISEKIKRQEEFVKSAEICLEVLGESFSDVRKGYGLELNDKTVSIFGKLTNGKYKTVNVNKELQMTVEKSDSFGMLETGYLSTGTKDQAYLSLRLAICELISEKENYPIFLDDALSNYDDIRAKTAVNFLNEYAKSGQVILFTCHKNVKENGEEIGAVSKNLK